MALFELPNAVWAALAVSQQYLVNHPDTVDGVHRGLGWKVRVRVRVRIGVRVRVRVRISGARVVRVQGALGHRLDASAAVQSSGAACGGCVKCTKAAGATPSLAAHARCGLPWVG
eukprot:scaffold5338_cov64-Phaeocystis_antarctica.AAC.3